MKIRHFIDLYKNFGSGVAWSALGASRFWRMNFVKHRKILDYLKANYSDFIESYRSSPLPRGETGAAGGGSTSINKNISPIWTVWWQGVDNLPDIVKICHASIRRHCGSHPFIILTSENFGDYVTLPAHVLEKFHSGAITVTHLTDIIRLALLYQHGGMWLDSTIFISGEIPRNVFDDEYFTIKRPPLRKDRNAAQNRWTNFLHSAKKGNLLCGFVYDFYVEYWKSQNMLIDYFLADYAILTACEEIPACKKILDSVSLVNYDIYRLENLLNETFSPGVYDELRKTIPFSKLSWRKPWKKKTIAGHETFFGHLLSEFLE
ncbi:MAG: capsular polysaccharide synthesis protein [Synergistaceae bacterium]|nr:capsular polysaccharide synthesis protein [Synergistaceae bacterium]